MQCKMSLHKCLSLFCLWMAVKSGKSEDLSMNAIYAGKDTKSKTTKLGYANNADTTLFQKLHIVSTRKARWFYTEKKDGNPIKKWTNGNKRSTNSNNVRGSIKMHVGRNLSQFSIIIDGACIPYIPFILWNNIQQKINLVYLYLINNSVR